MSQIEFDENRLCAAVARTNGIDKDDVKLVLNGLIKQIRDYLCLASKGVDSVVWVNEDIAFRAEYKPKSGKFDETVEPDLEISNFERMALERNCKQIKIYADMILNGELG